MFRLRDRVVLITGASSGIGEQTALAFARRGARLALCARRLDRLQAVAEQCRQAGAAVVTTRKADIGKRVDARAFVAGAIRDHQGADILVNNAGSGWMGRTHEMPADDVFRLVEADMLGVIWTTQAVLPAMLSQGRGVIVNVSSVTGFRASPYSAVYSATKHAVTGFSHALRGELSGTGVKVSVVYPGVTKTEFFDRTEAAIGPAYSPQWVARTIIRAARWPRRDVPVLPLRLAWLAEPILGGFLDHVLGEARRKVSPRLLGAGDVENALPDPDS